MWWGLGFTFHEIRDTGMPGPEWAVLRTKAKLAYKPTFYFKSDFSFSDIQPNLYPTASSFARILLRFRRSLIAFWFDCTRACAIGRLEAAEDTCWGIQQLKRQSDRKREGKNSRHEHAHSRIRKYSNLPCHLQFSFQLVQQLLFGPQICNPKLSQMSFAVVQPF